MSSHFGLRQTEQTKHMSYFCTRNEIINHSTKNQTLIFTYEIKTCHPSGTLAFYIVTHHRFNNTLTFYRLTLYRLKQLRPSKYCRTVTNTLIFLNFTQDSQQLSIRKIMPNTNDTLKIFSSLEQKMTKSQLTEEKDKDKNTLTFFNKELTILRKRKGVSKSKKGKLNSCYQYRSRSTTNCLTTVSSKGDDKESEFQSRDRLTKQSKNQSVLHGTGTSKHLHKIAQLKLEIRNIDTLLNLDSSHMPRRTTTIKDGLEKSGKNTHFFRHKRKKDNLNAEKPVKPRPGVLSLNFSMKDNILNEEAIPRQKRICPDARHKSVTAELCRRQNFAQVFFDGVMISEISYYHSCDRHERNTDYFFNKW